MSTLAPGDLCVIVENGYVKPEHHSYVGWHVVLLEEVIPDYWRTTRLPPGLAVFRTCLRKLPPPAIEVELPHMADAL